MCESFKSPKQEDLFLTEDYFCNFFFSIKKIKINKSVFVYFSFSYNVLCSYAVKLEFKNVPVDTLIEL